MKPLSKSAAGSLAMFEELFLKTQKDEESERFINALLYGKSVTHFEIKFGIEGAKALKATKMYKLIYD